MQRSGTLDDVLSALRKFRDERNWQQFHTPKNLAAAVSIEASELQETMLWKTDQEVEDMLSGDEGRERVQEEVADVLILGLLLCDRIGIDPIQAMITKIQKNEAKYPVHLAKGNARKYTDLKPGF